MCRGWTSARKRLMRPLNHRAGCPGDGSRCEAPGFLFLSSSNAQFLSLHDPCGLYLLWHIQFSIQKVLSMLLSLGFKPRSLLHPYRLSLGLYKRLNHPPPPGQPRPSFTCPPSPNPHHPARRTTLPTGLPPLSPPQPHAPGGRGESQQPADFC